MPTAVAFRLERQALHGLHDVTDMPSVHIMAFMCSLLPSHAHVTCDICKTLFFVSCAFSISVMCDVGVVWQGSEPGSRHGEVWPAARPVHLHRYPQRMPACQ